MIEVSSLLSLTAVAIKLQLEIILPLALFFYQELFPYSRYLSLRSALFKTEMKH